MGNTETICQREGVEKQISGRQHSLQNQNAPVIIFYNLI